MKKTLHSKKSVVNFEKMLALFIFYCASGIQFIGTVSSLQVTPHYNNVLDTKGGGLIFSQPLADTGGFEIFQRDLANNDESDGTKFDSKRAISAIGEVKPNSVKKIIPILSELSSIFEETVLSHLFEHIIYLLQNQKAVRQFPRKNIPSSGAFTDGFSSEKLLLEVENLPEYDESSAKEWLEKLKDSFQGTDMETLVSSIMELLEKKPLLNKYAKLCEDIDKAFGLDKPLDVASLGLPVPTPEKPEVYFQLEDARYPTTKFLVEVKLEGDQVRETIFIQSANGGSISNSFSVPNNQKNIEDLYRKLPISKLATHEP